MAGRAPAGWAAQAERCASSVPACFRDDPAVVHVFLNGARTFWGVEKLKPETLKWGETGETQVNACVERLPPRLTDDDVGITQEQWDRRAPPRRLLAARLPPAARCAPAVGRWAWLLPEGVRASESSALVAEPAPVAAALARTSGRSCARTRAGRTRWRAARLEHPRVSRRSCALLHVA